MRAAFIRAHQLRLRRRRRIRQKRRRRRCRVHVVRAGRPSSAISTTTTSTSLDTSARLVTVTGRPAACSVTSPSAQAAGETPSHRAEKLLVELNEGSGTSTDLCIHMQLKYNYSLHNEIYICVSIRRSVILHTFLKSEASVGGRRWFRLVAA
ncbi:hypothetical protein MA16_Dca014739 [Dendrobium catenatum]|uniref:Uncharacterized protein n=1 Tax=Dendrobium catenatum TaxID=906689 RepID=A0A2I0VIR9_9ASPA|nr:hypothetical protein MA16_Dca014739 [Dendrobium catenatum]